MMCLTFDFQFIATEDEEKALEGGAQTEASRRMEHDWIKSFFSLSCLVGMVSGQIL